MTTRVATIEEQLEQVLDELDLVRAIQNRVRREVRTTTQSTTRLERTVRQLAEISARTQALVVRQQETINQQQENINRILEYLENPNRGDTMPN